MKRKLQCVLVDDDNLNHELMRDYLSVSPIAELKECFVSPKLFLDSEPKLSFDVCLLDICMPDIDGFTVAGELKRRSRPFIFISGKEEKLFDALSMVEPIDVVPKAAKKERLFSALEKAYRIIEDDSKGEIPCEFGLFSVAGIKGKVKIQVQDILFVQTDNTDHRHKHIVLKGGERHVLMNCSFERLLALSDKLIRVNKSELISLNVLSRVEYDSIILKGVPEGNKEMQVTLNRWYKKGFMDRINIYT